MICFRSDIVRILLKRPDVDVNLATYYGTTALTYAIRNGNMIAVGELVAHPKINVNFQVSCHQAVTKLSLSCQFPEQARRERVV